MESLMRRHSHTVNNNNSNNNNNNTNNTSGCEEKNGAKQIADQLFSGHKSLEISIEIDLVYDKILSGQNQDTQNTLSNRKRTHNKWTKIHFAFFHDV